MLLFEPLYDSIVHTLIDWPGITIQKMHTLLLKEHKISLPNFYKVIGNLIDQQIVLKENGKLFLHNRRVLGIVDLADSLKENYLTEVSSISQLQEGQAIYYEATSIESLDGVWGDWMLSINRIYGEKEPSYVYQSRPYYALGMRKTEMAFFHEAVKLSPVYFLTGNTYFLDIYGASLYKQIGVTSLATDKVPFLKDGYCVTVIGDYVFEIIYPKEISDYFKIFFDNITELKDFNETLFHRIFVMKANYKLTLRRNYAQAQSVKKVFHKIFEKQKI